MIRFGASKAKTYHPFMKRRVQWILLTIVIGVSLLSFSWSCRAEIGNIVMNRKAEKVGMPPVVFPHSFHSNLYKCKDCHEGIFKMEKGANDITEIKMVKGQYCGKCHNGSITWPPIFCDRCHTGESEFKVPKAKGIKKRARLARGDGPEEMGDNLPTIDLGTGRTAVAIAVGFNHTCALLDDATVKCWGSNPGGQLGQGDAIRRGDGPGEMGDNLSAIDLGTGRTAVAIAVGRGFGSEHTCALLDDATVKCWGSNIGGQLGQGDRLARGDGPGEMGDNLPTIDLGTSRTAVAIAIGSGHTCALLDDATVKCWGRNIGGRLGQGGSPDSR